MKKWSFLVWFTMVFILAVTAGPSRAENRPFAFTLSPFVGSYLFDGDQPLENSPVFGVAVGYNIRERWGLEGAISKVDAESTVGSKDNVDVYNITLNALYHFRPNRALVPFVTAGVGGQSISHSGGVGSDQNLLFNYGAGLKYFLTEDFGLRAEVRHLLVRDSLESNSDVFNNLSFTVGLTFQLGGDRRALPKEAVWDTDSDGVPDKFDRCPGTPKGARADGFGCSN